MKLTYKNKITLYIVGSYFINDILPYNFDKFFFWSTWVIDFTSSCVVIFILFSNNFMVNYSSFAGKLDDILT